jgi:adenylate kinase family enzyme
VNPAHALWIGGPQGSGKSSVAAALAERWGLRLYRVDAQTGVHEERMPSTELGSLTTDEHADPETMLGRFVTTSRHRFRLVLEDLRALPDEPGCVVEGPQLFPTSVSAVLSSADHALFLAPDLDAMRERLTARGPIGGASERDLLIARTFEIEARELRLPTLRVDRPLDELIEAAAETFEPAVERLRRASAAGGTSR